jgi:hypothetical protein
MILCLQHGPAQQDIPDGKMLAQQMREQLHYN